MEYKLTQELHKSGKMQVTPEQSEAIQKALFDIGYEWKAGGTSIIPLPLHNQFIMWRVQNKKVSWEHINKKVKKLVLPLHLFDNHFETINH